MPGDRRACRTSGSTAARRAGQERAAASRPKSEAALLLDIGRATNKMREYGLSRIGSEPDPDEEQA